MLVNLTDFSFVSSQVITTIQPGAETSGAEQPITQARPVAVPRQRVSRHEQLIKNKVDKLIADIQSKDPDFKILPHEIVGSRNLHLKKLKDPRDLITQLIEGRVTKPNIQRLKEYLLSININQFGGNLRGWLKV